MSSATAAAPTSTTAAKQPPKKPYSIWFHPFVTWTDFFLSHLLPWFLPLGKLSARHSAITQDGQEANAKVQQKFCKMSHLGFHNQCRKLSKKTKTTLVTCTCKIPKSATILLEWNIIDEKDALLQQVMENEKDNDGDFVEVLVCCPARLVVREETTANESKGGVVEVDSMDLKSIPKHVPIVLWFHGGGLTLGTRHCTGLMDVASRLLQDQKSSQDVVFVSVDYRLAPDCKLPAASIDALAAADHLLKDGRNIHVSGESAGAYLATVTAFAAHSRYPGQVQSAYIRIPFLSPAADSMSYYMNGPACIAAPVSWLRWCWRAALDMPEDEDVVSDDITAVGSNRTAWNKSKWKRNEQWRRFLEPLEGVPLNLSTTRYIVGVSKADTLYDEGMELVKKLEQNGANVTCVESLGSHVFGFETDPKAYDALVDAWRSEVFGDDQQ